MCILTSTFFVASSVFCPLEGGFISFLPRAEFPRPPFSAPIILEGFPGLELFEFEVVSQARLCLLLVFFFNEEVNFFLMFESVLVTGVECADPILLEVQTVAGGGVVVVSPAGITGTIITGIL